MEEEVVVVAVVAGSGSSRVSAELPFAKHFAQRRNSTQQKLFQPQPLEAIISATSRGSPYEGESGRPG